MLVSIPVAFTFISSLSQEKKIYDDVMSLHAS